MPEAAQKGVVTVGFAVAAVGLTTTIPLPLYVEYAAMRGHGAGALSFAFACYALTVVVATPFLGPLPDRIGRKPCLLIGLGLAMLSSLLLALLPGITTLGVARILQGIGMGCVGGAAAAWAAELGGGDEAAARRGGVTVAMGTIASFGIGGLATLLALLAWPALRPPPTFALHILGTAVIALLVLRLPETLAAPRGGWLRLPVFPRGTLATTLAIIPAWGTTGTVLTSVPSVLAAQGFPLLGMAAPCVMMLIGAAAQQALKKLAPLTSVRLGLLLLAPGAALALYGAVANALWPLLLGTLAIGCSVYAYIYLGGLAAVAVAAGNERPRAVAGYLLVAHAGFSLVPLASGIAVDLFAAPTAFTGYVLCLLAASAVLLIALARPSQYRL